MSLPFLAIFSVNNKITILCGFIISLDNIRSIFKTVVQANSLSFLPYFSLTLCVCVGLTLSYIHCLNSLGLCGLTLLTIILSANKRQSRASLHRMWKSCVIRFFIFFLPHFIFIICHLVEASLQTFVHLCKHNIYEKKKKTAFMAN